MTRVAGLAAVVVLLVSCGGQSQVQFVSNERPSAYGAPQGIPPPSAAHAENPNGAIALPGDDEIVEPDHPPVDSKQERALVHIHGPLGVVCSGVVLGPRIVATAQQCLKAEGKGVTSLPKE